jgi:O-antigen ligase
MTALTGEEKHTDYHRSFLWQGTLDIIEENPVIGVGPGAWNDAIDATVLGYSQEHPRLWYAYEIIQRGHAHNDLMHLVAIAGPLCGLVFLCFIGLYIYRALGPSSSLEYEFWKWGPLVVFFGGLYQCYFQDDEVLLPFWLLVGLALRGYLNASRDATAQADTAPK